MGGFGYYYCIPLLTEGARPPNFQPSLLSRAPRGRRPVPEKGTPVARISLSLLGATFVGLPLLFACGEPMDPSGSGGFGPGTGAASGVGGTGATGVGGGASGGSPATGGGTGVTPSACGDGTSPFVVSAAEVNNLKFTSTIMLPQQSVAPQSLPSFDWSGVTENFLHNPVTETSITAMVILVWNATGEQIADMINRDDPSIDSFVEASIQLEVDATKKSAAITEFTSFGAPVDEATLKSYFDPTVRDPATTSFTLMAQQGTELGKNVQMIQSFVVDAGSANTAIVMDNTSTSLAFTADLPEGSPTMIPAAQAAIKMDWSTIGAHSYGVAGSFVNNKITEVLVGRYTKTIPEIEADFTKLEFIADDIWRGTVAVGTNLDLTTLMHETTNTPFAGVSNDGSTWLVALLCADCINPTPWYVSPLSTCP